MANQVSPLSLPGAAPDSLQSQGSSKLGKEEFLKLLTTQLANQNPLEPVDNQAFMLAAADIFRISAVLFLALMLTVWHARPPKAASAAGAADAGGAH